MDWQAERRALEAMQAQIRGDAPPAAAILDALRRASITALLGAGLFAALGGAWLGANPAEWRAAASFAVEEGGAQAARQAARSAVSEEALRRAAAVLPAHDLGEAADGVAALAPRVAAAVSPDGGAVTLIALGRTPEQAERIAAALSGALIGMEEEAARSRAARGLGWIEARLQRISARLAGADLRGATEEERATLLAMQDSLRLLLRDAAADAGRSGPGLVPVAEARAETSPLGPSRPGILLLAAAFGAALFALLHRLQERARGIPETLGDLVRDAGMPVLAATPASADPALRARCDPAGDEAEAARALRAPVLRVAEKRAALRRSESGGAPRGLIIAVAPGDRGAGAGGVAALFAESLARAGRSTCLVDADLQRPEQARRYRLEGEEDLFAALDGDIPLDAALWPSGIPDLTIAPAAPSPAGRADALIDGAGVEALDQLARRFDMVVISAPSPLVAAEGRALAGRADATLAVFRWGRADRAALRGMAQALRLAGAAPAGAVVTHAAGPARPMGRRRSRARFAGFAESFGD